MIVEPLSREHIAGTLTLCEEMHRASVFSELPFSVPKVRLLLLDSMRPNTPSVCFIALEAIGGGKQVVGFYGGHLSAPYFSQASVLADFALYVTPGYHGSSAFTRLLTAAMGYAWENGAKQFHLDVRSGINSKKVDKLFDHLGFTRLGHNYVLSGETVLNSEVA